ncbi:MAG: hypothetical protein VW405_11520, partial [Rhodospirillaceae bacterium]
VRMALATMTLAEDPAVRQALIAAVRDRLTEAGEPVTRDALAAVFDAERMKIVGPRRSGQAGGLAAE